MPDEPPFRGKRLFVAIDLPDYLRTSIGGLHERIKGFHWVAPERYHLTLKFIGDVPGQFQGEIEQALNGLEVGPFFLPVQGIGRFPERGKPHAVWVGLGNGHPRLFQLQKRIDDALFNIGIEPERRRYQPHLTIARVNQASEEVVRQYLKRHDDFEAPPFRVTQFHLYLSDMAEGRVRYRREQTWNLQEDGQSGAGEAASGTGGEAW